ncbi:ABC transporter permease [Pseudomonas sp. WS 5018]|nr:ABC transporter permease [Pseudomonas sp. WS 5018]CAD2251703.1 Teichoic acid translocation permease protein TagG [Stutzerimonas stutzeri]
MFSYLVGVWNARYFWTHLSFSDLRSRWRRSFFGILWTIIQPLGMTLLLSIVFGKIFNVEIREYAPYILSGMILWEFVTASAIGGALAFVQADAYIKQCRHPLAIYTLRTVFTNAMVLGLASLSLVAWVLVVMPQNFGWTWLAALTIYPILIFIAWPMATFLAYIATRFRDLPHALGLVLQAMWFVSPIYFEAKVFRGGDLHWLVDLNPIYHLLEIVRAPLLHGAWPTIENYVFCGATILTLSLLAIALGQRTEKKVIFYL